MEQNNIIKDINKTCQILTIGINDINEDYIKIYISNKIGNFVLIKNNIIQMHINKLYYFSNIIILVFIILNFIIKNAFLKIINTIFFIFISTIKVIEQININNTNKKIYFYKRCDLVLLIFNLNDRYSFYTIKKIMPYLTHFINDINTFSILIGNITENYNYKSNNTVYEFTKANNISSYMEINLKDEEDKKKLYKNIKLKILAKFYKLNSDLEKVNDLMDKIFAKKIEKKLFLTKIKDIFKEEKIF